MHTRSTAAPRPASTTSTAGFTACLVTCLVTGLFASLAPRSADAQARNLLDRRLDAGVLLPPTSVATEQSTFALGYNPAGVLLGPTGLGYLHEEGDGSLAGSRRGDGIFARLGGLTEGKRSALALGAALEWVRDDRSDCDPSLPCTRRTSLGLAFGGPQFSIGIAYRHFSTDEDPDLDGLTTWDAGLVLRPAPWLSIGALATAFNGPSFPGNRLPRLYTAGIGLRPFGPRLTLAGDFSLDGHDGFDSGRFAWLAGWRVLPALELVAQVAHPLHDTPGGDVVAQLALRGGFRHSTHAVTGGTGFGGGSGPSLLIDTEVIAARSPSLFGPGRSAHVVNLDELLEGPGPLESLLPGRDPLDPATRLALRLQRLARDESVGALVVRVRRASGLGFARLEELRSLFSEFRQRNVPVVVQLESSTDAEYYLATAADRILVTPQALLEINGLSSQRVYLRGLLDLLGVTPEFVRAGDFKSAPEQFEREGPSEEAAENVNWLLDDAFDRYVQAIAQARGLAPERVRDLLNEGLMEASAAREAGLVDDLAATPDQVERVVHEVAGRRLSLHPAGPRASVPLEWGAVPSIGLVEIRGNILPGDGGGSGTAAAGRIARQLRKAAEDPSVRAVVVRIESPGGDVTASEIIYAAMQEARKRKPVVVSMGDVAASGGYYVAMGADHIVAEPGTLTGSIGVFAGKADLSELLRRIGISTARFVRGDRADILSVARPWSEGEREVVQRVVDRFYDVFLERVSENRKLGKEQLAELAGGRVWTGAQAMERGLVDSLGGLSHALAEARRRAGLPPQARVAVQSSPGIFELPEAPSQPFLDPASWLPPGASALLAKLAGVDDPAPLLAALATSPAERRRLRQLAEVLLLLDGRALALAIDLPVSP